MLGEKGQHKVLLEALDHQKKRTVLTLLKQTLFLSLHYNVDNRYFFVNGKKSLDLKLTMKMCWLFNSVSSKNKVDLLEFMIKLDIKYYLTLENMMLFTKEFDFL